MFTIYRVVIAVAALLTSFIAVTSPTSSDFEICKIEAVKVFEMCLKSHHGNYNSIYQCWPDNEKRYRDCVSSVLARYSPSEDAIRAMKARAEAEKKAKAEYKASQKTDNN